LACNSSPRQAEISGSFRAVHPLVRLHRLWLCRHPDWLAARRLKALCRAPQLCGRPRRRACPRAQGTAGLLADAWFRQGRDLLWALAWGKRQRRRRASLLADRRI